MMDFYELKEKLETKLNFAKYYGRVDQAQEQVDFLEIVNQYAVDIEENLHKDCFSQDHVDDLCAEREELEEEMQDFKEKLNVRTKAIWDEYQAARKNSDDINISYLDGKYSAYKEIGELVK